MVTSGAALAASQAGPGGAPNTLTAAETAAGWTLLFDGQTLSGWSRANRDADWHVNQGAITYTTGGGLLWTDQEYGDFELTLDFLAAADANTGVFLRCSEPGPKTCYEVNIFDAHETDPTGSIFGVHSVLPKRPATAGTWNSYAITASGNHLVIRLNGEVVTDIRDTTLNLVRGRIGLQAGGPGGPGVARFRNLKVRPL